MGTRHNALGQAQRLGSGSRFSVGQARRLGAVSEFSVACLVVVLGSVLLMVSDGELVSASGLSWSYLVSIFGAASGFGVVGLGVGRPCSAL